jgi:5-methylcytosine-specific restriction enzyme subunit McrC
VTLDRILRLGLQQDEAMAQVRTARRALLGSVQLVEMDPHDCENRCYHRLNADYEPLHTLVRLRGTNGSGRRPGGNASIPFTVNMGNLFEWYVAACQRRYAPPEIAVSAQHVVYFHDERNSKVIIDTPS